MQLIDFQKLNFHFYLSPLPLKSAGFYTVLGYYLSESIWNIKSHKPQSPARA